MSLLKCWESLGIWGTKMSRHRDSDLELKQKKCLYSTNYSGEAEN